MRKFLKNELKFTISLIDMFTWVYSETNEESQSNRKGSQWALNNASVVHGPQQPLVDFIIYARGLYGETLVKIWRSLIHILSV